MDSLKMFKGYGKVEQDNNHNHLEDQQQQQHHQTHRKPYKPLVATVSIFAILFLTLTLAFALGALIHHTNNEPPEPTESPNSPNSALSATESIRACNVTRFPTSCFTSISSSLNTTITTATIDPESILKLSLRVSIHELSNLASSLSASSAGGPALADCREQVDDAVSRLNESLSAAAAAGGGGKGLTEAAIADVRTWVSAAVTDQQTCLDGLEEMGSEGAAEVRSKMEKCGEYTSNSLAIVANIKTLMEKSRVPRH